MTDLFDRFDPMPYMTFIESVKQPTGRTVPRPVGLRLVTKPYAKFANKRSRSWPDGDLIMTDVFYADQLGAFMRVTRSLVKLNGRAWRLTT